MKYLLRILLASVWLVKVSSIEVIGHRGSPFEKEENTVVSFKKAFEQGADAIEGDFWLTGDGKIVCSHDPIQYDIDFRHSSLEEIRRTSPLVPTLEEVLEVVPPGKKIYIEIKHGTKILPYLEEIVERSGLSKNQITFLSFDPDVVRELRSKIPAINTYYSIAFFFLNQRLHQRKKTVAELLQQAVSANASGLCLEGFKDQITQVLSLQDSPLPWVVWTVDEKERAHQFKQMGAQGIITNFPLKIREGFHP